MALTPESTSLLPDAVQRPLDAAWGKLQGLIGHFTHRDFAPEAPLAQMPGVDPHFIPRAPMTNANLDAGLLAKLSNEGYKRGKEITAATHPELYQAWTTMCARAGLDRVPQLILGESKALNAASLNGENAVMLSTGLLKKLNLREVTAVLGHELGHEASDHTTPRVLALGLLGGGGAVVGDEIAHRGGIGSVMKFTDMQPGRFKNVLHVLFNTDKKPLSMLGYATYIFAGGAVGMVAANQLSVRPTELDADRKGAMISGDPAGLISALGKLEEGRKNTLAHFFRKIQSGYPSTEKRIANLHAIAASNLQLVPVSTTTPGATADAEPAAPAMPASATPSATIHAATQSERVGAVEPALRRSPLDGGLN